MRTPTHSIFRGLVIGTLVIGCVSCSPQAKKAAHLKQADGYFASGQLDKAEIEYMNVLQLESYNPQAIGRLGLIYADQGRLGRVMPYLLKGRELQPDNLDLRMKLGLFFLSARNLKEANDEAVFILDRQPQNAEAPLLLAEAATKPEEIEAARQRLLNLAAPAVDGSPVLVALGNLEFRQRRFKEAEGYFRRAQTKDPDSSAVQAAWGAWSWTQKDLPEAERAYKRAAELAPARSPRGLLYAKFKIQNGEVPAGRKALDEIVRKTPDYLPAWVLLAELALAEKKYPESAALLAKVLALDPMHPEALLLNARLQLAQGEMEKAVTETERMLKIYPRSPQVHYQLALAYSASGNSQKAIGSLKQAVALAPGFTEAILLLAELNLRNGDSRMAITALKSLMQRHPEIAQARFVLANAYRSQGDLNEAIAVYLQMEESYPNIPQPPYMRGMVLLQENKPAEARVAFTKALTVAPDFLLASEQLISLDLFEKNNSAARQRVDDLIAKDPKQPGPYLLQAKVYLIQREHTLAENALRKAIELQPDSPAAYFMLARLYKDSNQLEKALTNYQVVIDKNPKSIEALMMIGVIYTQQKNFPPAKEAYEKLLAVNPRFSPALNNLAYLYSEQLNDLEKAQKMAQKARDLLPYEPHTADTLGWILYKRQQYPLALSFLVESAAKLPDSAEVQFHLGMAHYMMGEEEPARRALQRTMQLEQSFPASDEVGRQLAVLAINAKNPEASDRARLEKMIAEQPDDPGILVRLAVIYAREGATGKAIAAYQAALRTNPKNVSVMMELARLLVAQGETTKALDLAKNAHILSPDDSEVTHLLGHLALQTRDYRWAFSLLQEAMRKTPDDVRVLFDFAEAAYSVGQVPEAEAAMQRVVQGKDGFPQANEARQFLELTALAANPAPTSAETARIEQILKINPLSVPALMARAAINEQKAEAGAAEKTYEKVLERYPDFAPAKKRLALLYAENPANTQKAFDLALKAREVLPADPELAGALGIILYKRSDYAKAVNLLKEATEAKEANATWIFYLGMAQYRLKMKLESRRSLQRALDLHLRADFAAEAQRTLAELK